MKFTPQACRTVHLELILHVGVDLRGEMRKGKCHHCLSEETVRNGSYRGVQRYNCKNCGRSFSSNGQRVCREKKEEALEMYLNSVGIRKIARFLEVSPTSVLNWIKKSCLKEKPPAQKPGKEIQEDSIEMDEIYTFVKKRTKSSSLDSLFSQGELCDCLCNRQGFKCCQETLCFGQSTTP